jgi:hypothetical protein
MDVIKPTTPGPSIVVTVALPVHAAFAHLATLTSELVPSV